jgi:SPP1 family predicted phage head-tail adaptor
MINFGKYDQKVTFVTFQSVSDGAGGTVLTPLTSLVTFAAVKQTRGNNELESGQMVMPNTYNVRIQYRTLFEPDETYQIIYRTKYYKITSISLESERQHKEYVINMIGI